MDLFLAPNNVGAALKAIDDRIMSAYQGHDGHANPMHYFMPSRLPSKSNTWGSGGGWHDAYTDGTVCSAVS
jgi:hypothetical protein